jgi:hypothetical protein
MTPFGQPKFTLVQTPLKNPRFLVDPSMSAETFDDPVNWVDFGQMSAHLGHHLENITDKP